MSIKTKIFVVLAALATLAYGAEVALTILGGNLGAPVFVKAGLVVFFVGYIVVAIKKSRSNSETEDTAS